MSDLKRAYLKLEVSLHDLDPTMTPISEAEWVRNLLVEKLHPELETDIEVEVVESAGYTE